MGMCSLLNGINGKNVARRSISLLAACGRWALRYTWREEHSSVVQEELLLSSLPGVRKVEAKIGLRGRILQQVIPGFQERPATAAPIHPLL